jgi:hypothetical protein
MQQGKCFACGKSSDVVPLIPLVFRDTNLWICPQDLPTLIHHPEKLNLGVGPQQSQPNQ